MKRKLRFLMVETANTNLGDNVIADTNCKLLRYAMFPRSFELFHYNVDSHDVEQIRYVDAVIFCAGILKSTNEKLWFNIPEIMHVAQRYGVPVFMSGIGAEPIENNEKGLGLKEAVNLPCVKVISCRDDTACLKQDYLPESNAEVYEVFDSALWCKNTYRAALKHSPYQKNKRVIGLGVIRPAIFPEYGNAQITRQMQIDFWTDAIAEIEAQGYEWKLFTNGATGDEQFATELIELLGRGEKLPAPRNANELVRYIDSFGAVLAGRMHSNIIAYALGVPSVGLIWNKKLRIWGEKIGYPERFIEPDALDGTQAAQLVLAAAKKLCRVRLSQKLPSLKAYRRFLKYVKARDIAGESVALKSALCARSLGSIDVRYRYTNSPQALKSSLAGGYENVHADVRLTADKKPVLIKRWNPAAYRKMSVEFDEENPPKALSLEQFMHARYYNRFKPYKLQGFLKDVGKDERVKNVILSFGNPSTASLERMIKAVCEYDFKGSAKLLLCFESEESVALYRSLGYSHEVMYYCTDAQKLGTAVAYCAENDISYLRVKLEDYQPSLQQACEAQNIEIAVLNCDKVEEIVQTVHSGARFVGSCYYDVHYLERLIHVEESH